MMQRIYKSINNLSYIRIFLLCVVVETISLTSTAAIVFVYQHITSN